jgi:hypothetical protein
MDARARATANPATFAEHLGVHERMIYRQDRAETVDPLYRLACAAIGAGLGGWSWE